MHSARYVRLYMGAGGESHFEDIEVPLSSVETAAAGQPLNLAQFLPATETQWINIPSAWPGNELNIPGRRLVFCTVDGEYQVTAGDGEVRCFPAGSVLLIEDSGGSGQITSITNGRGALVLAVVVDSRSGAGAPK